ncbi:hypothetical protein J1614_008393 [Plenodomus biglobosus]|nr:hypothetical protein J1614_008393 [Plenodomus biglobosus]
MVMNISNDLDCRDGKQDDAKICGDKITSGIVDQAPEQSTSLPTSHKQWGHTLRFHCLVSLGRKSYSFVALF